MNAVYFKNIEDKIIKEIQSTNQSIIIAVAWFTNNRIFDELINRLHDSISISLLVVYDQINIRESGLDFNKYISCGGILYLMPINNLMHNKFAIFDSKTIVSGSYNWTFNAEHRNKENVLFIKNNAKLALKFIKEFSALTLKTNPQISPIKIPELLNKQNQEYISSDLIHKAKAFLVNEKYEEALKVTTEILLYSDKNDEYAFKEIENIKRDIKEQRTSFKDNDRVIILYKDGKQQRGIIKYSRVESGKLKYFINRDGYKAVIGFYGKGDVKLFSETKAPISYYYHIEDFQFTRYTRLNYLAGEEGDIVKIHTDSDLNDEVYILFIEFNYIDCIGNIERSFPKTQEEHNEIKLWRKDEEN